MCLCPRPGAAAGLISADAGRATVLNLHTSRYALILPLRCVDCRRLGWVLERWMSHRGERFAQRLLCEGCAAERVAQNWFVVSVISAQDQRCSGSTYRSPQSAK